MPTVDAVAFEGLLVDLEAYADEHDVPICRRDRGMFLYQLAKQHRPEHAVEIGAAIGYSTALIARALAENGTGRITSIDISPKAVAATRTTLARVGVADIATVVEADGTTGLKQLTTPIDFLFLDADKPSYITYFHAAEPLLTDGAVIVADNVGRFPDQMADYLAEVRRRFDSRTQIFPEDKMEVSIYRKG